MSDWTGGPLKYNLSVLQQLLFAKWRHGVGRMRRLEGSEGSIWTSNWMTLGGTSNQSRSLLILNLRDLEIQQKRLDFVSTNHLASTKAD